MLHYLAFRSLDRMAIPLMKHGQDARATLDRSRFCKSLRFK